jgi:hypothetical protein
MMRDLKKKFKFYFFSNQKKKLLFLGLHIWKMELPFLEFGFFFIFLIFLSTRDISHDVGCARSADRLGHITVGRLIVVYPSCM